MPDSSGTGDGSVVCANVRTGDPLWRVSLFRAGINFNDVPAWQKRGIGVYWEIDAKPGLDPRSGEATTAIRRRLTVNLELPRGEAYDALIRRRLHPETAEGDREG